MISIIVPIYNGEKFIKDCIYSLLNQTCSEIEIILVNDGSQDNTAEIIDNLKDVDDRIFVYHQKNQGVSVARNNGINLAKGKYIMFCDCDDVVEPTWCEELLDCAERYTDRLPICWVKMVGGDNCDYVAKEDAESDRLYTKHNKEDIMKLYYTGILDNPVSKIYNAEIIRENKLLFKENLNMGEDSLFNFQYLSFLNGRIVTINKYLYRYIRQNNNSLMTRKSHELNAVESAYYGFVDMYKKIGLLNGVFEEELYACFYQKYIDALDNCRKDTNINKVIRMKYCRRIIYSKGFSSCVGKVSPMRVYSRRLWRMSQNRMLFLLYIYLKIVRTF